MNSLENAMRVRVAIAALALAVCGAPASAQLGGAGLEKMFGPGTNLDFGLLEMERDVSTGEIRTLKMKNGVDMRSETMTLVCDYLLYDAANGKLIAEGKTGKPLHMKDQNVDATCHRLEISPTKDGSETVLKGSPVVKQKFPGSAQPMVTTGNEITIIQTPKSQRILVGDGSIKTGNGKSGGDGQTSKISVPDPEAARGQKEDDAKEPDKAPKAERLNGGDKAKAPSVSE